MLDAALGHGMGSVMGARVHDRGVVLARNEPDNGHSVCSERDLAPFGAAEQSRTPIPDATLGELRAMAEQQEVVNGRVRSLQHPADHAGGLVPPGAASQPSGALRPSRADLLTHPGLNQTQRSTRGLGSSPVHSHVWISGEAIVMRSRGRDRPHAG